MASLTLELGAELAKLRLLERLGRIVLFELVDGEPGGVDRVLCDLYQVTVERHALLGLGSMLDCQRPALGTAEVVGEDERDVLAGLAQESRQHTHAVDQQARVGRLMDRGLDDGRVAAQTPTILDPLPLCGRNERTVDTLQRLRTYLLEVALQGRLLRWLVREPDETERAVALGVGQMERELLVAEPVRLLDHQRTQDLFAAHAVAPALSIDTAGE